MSLNGEDEGNGQGPWGPGGGPPNDDSFEKIRQAEAKRKKTVRVASSQRRDVGADGGLSPYSTDPQRIIDQGTTWRRNWSTAGPGGLTEDLARAYAEAVNNGQVQERGDIDIGPSTIELRFDPESQQYDYYVLTHLWRDPKTKIEYVPDKDNGDRLKFRGQVGSGYREVVVTMVEINKAAEQSFKDYRAKRSGRPLHVFQMSNAWTGQRFLEQFSRFKIDVSDSDLVPIGTDKIRLYNRDYPIPLTPKPDSKNRV